MKNFLSMLLIFTLSFILIGGSSFAESNLNLNKNTETSLYEDAKLLSDELNSKPIKLNDGSYFVPDNRPSTLLKASKDRQLAVKSGLITPYSSGTIQYGYVFKDFNVATPSGYSCTVRSTSYVKTIYEYNVYRFLECQSVQWSAFGSSSYSVNPTGGNYNISGSGRYLEISGAFNVETTVSYSTSVSFGAAGWSVGGSVGSNYIVRKWVTPRFTFDGNYAGAILH